MAKRPLKLDTPQPCLECGTLFPAQNRLHKFCCPEHRKAYNNRKRRNSKYKKTAKEKTCSQCGQPFVIGVSETLCSNECMAKHMGIDRPFDPWQRGAIPPDQLGDNLVYTPSFGAGF